VRRLWGAKITSASETLNLYRELIEQRYGKWLVVASPASGHLSQRETSCPPEMPPNRTRMEFWRPTTAGEPSDLWPIEMPAEYRELIEQRYGKWLCHCPACQRASLAARDPPALRRDAA